MRIENFKRLEYYRTHYPNFYNALICHRNHKGEKITFKKYRYLIPIYLDESDYIVIRKSTQCGATEWLIITALNKANIGRGVFYVLPTYSLVSRFVKNRMDASIQFTPYYKMIQKNSPMEKKRSESVSLLHFGRGVIAFVGSNSSAGFTEFPADDLIIDELDECDQENLPMAEERLSASKHKKYIKIANPTISSFGIDAEYKNTDMKRWMLKCPHCSNWLNPDFFIHVVKEVEENQYMILDQKYNRYGKKDIDLICEKCGKEVDRFSKGVWIAQRKSDKSGYHINKLFSTNTKIKELMERFENGLSDETILQRFYNGDLGVPYTGSGAKLTYDILDACKKSYIMPQGSQKPCVCGIDVGSVMHVKISEILPDNILRTVFIGELPVEYQEIVDLRKKFNIICGCIDALPEQSFAKKVCRLKGFFKVFYSDSAKRDSVNPQDKIVTVNRTASLDQVRSSYIEERQLLPQNADKILPVGPDGKSEFYNQMCASTRVLDEKKNRYDWKEGDLPDHYFHADNYMLIAKRVLAQFME